MSRFPRIYAESTITRMNKKLALPQETMSLLYDYFETFANLYQLLPLKDAYKIISRQNKGLITLDEFIAFSEIARHEKHYYYILAKDELYLDAPKEEPIDRELVHSCLVDIDYEDYYNMVKHQAGKPLKILPKQELLKYKDDMYIADTPYVRAMMNFLCTRLQLSVQRAEDIISDFILIITCDDRPFDAVSKMLDRVKIKMTESQLEDFIKLFTNLDNNTRLPQNRGFTPHELSTYRGGQEVIDSISFGPNITAAFKSGEADIEEYRKEILMSELPEKVKMDMLRQLSQIEGKNTTQKKVGRNNPCHCGSGKKYKKCCGK